MDVDNTFSRQRVPMVDAVTLEDRTRPATDDWLSTRMRYYQWPSWSDHIGPARLRALARQPLPMQARVDRL